MTHNLLSQFHHNRTEPILATPSTYQAFKEKIESQIKANGFDGNTIVLTPSKPYEMAGSVAVLSFKGFTVNTCSELEEMFFGCVSLQGFCDDLQQAVADDDVTEVVIDFDSGGGYTMYGDETCEMVKALAEIKPIYAYTSGLMCSMAYEVASNCTNVIASPSALVGSIGVYCEYFDLTEAMEQQGVKVTTFQGGSEKTIGSPFIPLSKEQAATIQARIDQQYAEFKATVRSNRGTVADEVMQGQTFTGKEAMMKNTNLIDGNVNSLGQFLQLVQASNQ